MGNSQSLNGGESKLSQQVRSQNSYFGQSSTFSNVDENNVEESIRDIQFDRLYRYSTQRRDEIGQYSNFQDGLGIRSSSTSGPTQLKSVISVQNPSIKLIGSVYLLTFSLKSEAPGRIVLSSNGMINSLNFEVNANNGQQNNSIDETPDLLELYESNTKPVNNNIISLPLPNLTNFFVEVNPDLDKAQTQIDKGFQFVIKHMFNFHIDVNEELVINYTNQIITTADNKVFDIPMNKPLPIDTNPLPEGKCMICLSRDADTAIAECGHKVVCDQCLCSKAVRLHHCPICSKPTSF